MIYLILADTDFNKQLLANSDTVFATFYLNFCH